MNPPPIGRSPGRILEGWHGWLGTYNGIALITLAALPMAALAVWVLARRRSATGATQAWRTSLADVGIVYGTVPWVWVIMLPGSRAGTVPGRVSLVPVQDLLSLAAGGPFTVVTQIVGNLLVFAALGFFGPLRFAALMSVRRVLALAAGCSVLVEAAQYVLQLDRVSSVDDVLLNTAGAGLAALASSGWWRAPDGASSGRVRPVPGRSGGAAIGRAVPGAAEHGLVEATPVGRVRDRVRHTGEVRGDPGQ